MEVVGLVLAIVPLVSSAASHWTTVYRGSKTLLHQKAKDDAILADYRQIHWDLAILEIRLQAFVEILPDLSSDEKTTLLRPELDFRTTAWTSPRVAGALDKQLGTVDRREAVLDCLNTICAVLEDIISDRTLGLKKSDLVVAAQDQSRPIYTKLETISRNLGQQSEGLFKRLHFTTNTSRRHRARKELHQHVATFERLVENRATLILATQNDVTFKADPAEISRPPDPRHRTLIHGVYNAIESKWNCECAPRHRAKMCLKRRFSTFDDDSIASLDILISIKDNLTGGWWHEGCVVLDPEPQSPRASSRKVTFANSTQSRRRRSSASLVHKQPVKTAICDLAHDACQKGVTLELMFDNISLWQLPSQLIHQRLSHGGDGVTLREVLQRSKAGRDKISNTAGLKISLKDRRYLAVLLARSLLDFSETCWLRESWNKDAISFLTTDVKCPYLTTDFRPKVSNQEQGQPEAQTSSSLLVLHPCLPLLNLGILLLEIQEDVGFIDERLESDGLVLGQIRESSNLLTAEKMLEELADHVEGGDTSDYVTAVQACLKCDWIPDEATAFSLSNEDCRMWIYQHVVVPLERNLFRGWKLTVTDE